MPATLSYPGVYIEELSSGVRTITGVATSVTAFVGRALRGPTDQDARQCPVLINSYGEFERIFGGLWIESTLGFAVRDFFSNGGSQALIVRIYKSDGVAPPSAILAANGLALRAASQGAWGGQLRVRIDHDTRTTPAFPTEDIGKLFNLSVKDMGTGQTEIFRNVSIALNHPRFIGNVLENESTLLRTDTAVAAGAARPGTHAAIAAGTNPDPFSNAFPTRFSAVPPASAPGDGLALGRAEVSALALEGGKTGMYALLRADLFNLLCIPPHAPASGAATNVESGLVDDATTFCKNHRAFFIVDPPYTGSQAVLAAKNAIKGFPATVAVTNYAALYFPTLRQPNPLHDDQIEEFAPCGVVAGIMARTDAQRGVWKAPAGQDATLVGVPKLSVALDDGDIGELNPLGINCLRSLPAAGRVVWGARTLEGNDRLASEWKYIPVRRTALFIEESLFRGTQWVVFEPNDEPLWAQIRLNLGAFMHNLFRQGAFQGTTPKEAYFVKCDKETTTQTDINLGIVNILVGFAPLKPAEFVVIKIQQIAGQIET
ncbi:MAG: uncharacterized protein QOH01_2379 [Verrucomicrobiota bacterium]|jgi:phage tail sheath protein FI